MPLSKVQNIFWGKVCHTSWARCFVKTLLRNISGDTGDWGLDMITPLFTSSGEWIPLSFEQRAQIMQIFTLYDARHALSDNRKFDVCLPVRALRKLEDNLARTWVSGPFVICLWLNVIQYNDENWIKRKSARDLILRQSTFARKYFINLSRDAEYYQLLWKWSKVGYLFSVRFCSVSSFFKFSVRPIQQNQCTLIVHIRHMTSV